jgi:serine/threonine-protein kinase
VAATFCGHCGAALAVSRSENAAVIAAEKKDKFIGCTIEGRYRIVRLIGLGGMGSVYRATRLLIGDEVAMKILHTERVSDPHAAERFRREAQAAARLKHPNVVSIYDVGITSDGLQYLVMELLEGQSLRQIIRQEGPLPASVAVEITTQICAALDEAHRQHIVHRDIKPDNIIIHSTLTGLRVKVLDFGIAKLRDDVASHITQTGSVMGTPHYMSPEQCLGEELDSRADIYSLGIMLYEMLCGRVPFNAPVSTAVVVQHVNQPPPSLCAINPGISPQVEAVVFHALAKQRAARPPTAGALARELTTAVYPTSVPASIHPTWPQMSGPLQPPTHNTEETVRRSAPASEMPATVIMPASQASGPTPFRSTVPGGAMGATQTNQRLLWTIGAAVLGVVLLGAVVAMIAWSLRKPNDVAGLNKPDNSGTTEKTGTFAINPQFSGAWGFSDGLAPVRIGDDKTYRWGFIDKTGKVVIFPQFFWSSSFSEGLAAVRSSEANFKWGFIDKGGKVVITPQFDYAAGFNEGLAWVRIGDAKTGKYGYIDKTGKVVITPQFDGGGSFSEGLAAVMIGDAKTGRWGYIDKTGKMVVTPQFDSASGFSEGLAAVRIGDDKTGRWGCIDKTGQVVITPQFDWAGSFSEDLAPVRIGDDKAGKYGYIDKAGKLVVAPQFDWAYSFLEGRAQVRIGDNKTGKWGYIYR